jgi:hypothetical protein
MGQLKICSLVTPAVAEGNLVVHIDVGALHPLPAQGAKARLFVPYLVHN